MAGQGGRDGSVESAGPMGSDAGASLTGHAVAGSAVMQTANSPFNSGAPGNPGIPGSSGPADPRPNRPRNSRKSGGSRGLLVGLICFILVGFGLIGAGVWTSLRSASCPGGRNGTDLYGNCVSLDIAADKEHGVEEDGNQVPGQIDIPAVNMHLGLRYMKTTGSLINPLNSTDWWLDESLSAGWPHYNGRLLVTAHSLPTSGPGSGPSVAGAGNEVQGWGPCDVSGQVRGDSPDFSCTGPKVGRWPKVGDVVILNRTHDYVITGMFHASKLKAGADPRVVNSDSLVLMTCYRGSGFTADANNTDNWVILTRPTPDYSSPAAKRPAKPVQLAQTPDIIARSVAPGWYLWPLALLLIPLLWRRTAGPWPAAHIAPSSVKHHRRKAFQPRQDD